ncbi:M56 family metallopeptidase [Aequorivita antarctica]|uniref:M56 family metallopeptidase n=1 Tax=Aequorivita antarctica TaxID=153266 RepID=A0A5C6YVK6_9FLAO|nr:M56 family metallopeptidase [Aequorivita antarctica]TXD71631.1 M56 family metallopeptidase [Aequorivita antarctica]SRX75913.1 Regulatory protein BlaR1 [Aequorivita antarctica]
MEMYILKSAACLALFFAFYKLFLENTSIHTFKRFYLFGSLLASFLIPLITFTTYVETSVFIASYTEGTPQLIFSEAEETINYWPYVLWTVYGLGVLFFSLKFFRNLFGLIQQIQKNQKYRNSSFINVLLLETVIPHTFFNYIFLNKTQFENQEIPAEVMLHEEAHALQRHSLDVIFIEILQILFWFNPFVYFLKRSVKLNHEFLADRAVLNAGAETSAYQKILLAFSSNAVTPSLAHSLNYSSIKKRFTVMKKHTSKRAIWLRSLLLLPLLSLLIYGFSTKEIVKKEIQSEIVQQKATKAEIAEYNKLAKKYNAVDIEKRIIKKDDLERLEIIYKKMTDEQKANAEPFPECIPPPPSAPKVKKGEKSDIPPPPAPKAPSAENGNLYTPAQAPPPPNPDPVEYIKELGKRGATFYIGPHKYSTDEAIELVRKSKEATIDVSKYPDVHLGGC